MANLRIMKDENVVRGVTTPGVLAGRSNYDTTQIPESNLTLPWFFDPKVSWVDFRCWIETYLDSGIVVHHILPQGPQQTPDTLASVFIDDNSWESNQRGVNTTSNAPSYLDFKQQMATPKYRFRLKGWAQRFGYQVPIPGLKTVCGITAIPDDNPPQMGYNVIMGNYNGIPLWFAEWESWYTILQPPHGAQLPPPNLAAHIRADQVLPTTGDLPVPFSQPDSNAIQQTLPPLLNPLAGP